MFVYVLEEPILYTVVVNQNLVVILQLFMENINKSIKIAKEFAVLLVVSLDLGQILTALVAYEGPILPLEY